MNPEHFEQEYEVLKERLTKQHAQLPASDFIELVVAQLMLDAIAISKLKKELESYKDCVLIYKEHRCPSHD